jgi:hypothetical protein
LPEIFAGRERDVQQICLGGCLRTGLGHGRERVIANPVGVPPTAKPFDVIEGKKIVSSWGRRPRVAGTRCEFLKSIHGGRPITLGLIPPAARMVPLSPGRQCALSEDAWSLVIG